MKTLFVLFAVMAASCSTNAQLYSGLDLGLNFKPHENNSPFVSLHIGYQKNEVFITDGVALFEYNQRMLEEGVYVGGRAGYGVDVNENTTIIGWAGRYYKKVSSDNKLLNKWVPGYGISALWKNATIELNYAEFFQASVGCRVTLN